jgi:hypothetical protein
LEFRILDIPYEYVDKCSALEKEYYWLVGLIIGDFFFVK